MLRETVCAYREYLPSADGRASCRRNVLKGNVHFVDGKTRETDPIGVGAITTRSEMGLMKRVLSHQPKNRVRYAIECETLTVGLDESSVLSGKRVGKLGGKQ